MKHLIACFLLVLSTGFVGWGQEEESPRYVCITMQGGLVRCGTLVSDDGIQVILDTPELGKVMLYKSSMIRIEDAEPGTYEAPVEVDIMSQDRIIDKDRAIQSSRYLFAPSAHSLREGEGYWNLSPVGGNITYALDDNTMAGLSASWLGYGFTFKQSFDLKEDFRMSVGGLMQAGWTGTATSTANPDDLTVGSGYLFSPFSTPPRVTRTTTGRSGWGTSSGARGARLFHPVWVYRKTSQRNQLTHDQPQRLRAGWIQGLVRDRELLLLQPGVFPGEQRVVVWVAPLERLVEVDQRVGLLGFDRGGRQRTASAVVEPDQAILRHRALGEVVKGI